MFEHIKIVLKDLENGRAEWNERTRRVWITHLRKFLKQYTLDPRGKMRAHNTALGAPKRRARYSSKIKGRKIL